MTASASILGRSRLPFNTETAHTIVLEESVAPVSRYRHHDS